MSASVIPYFGSTITGMSREDIVKEMTMHLIAGRIDPSCEDEAFEYLYDVEQRYGYKIIEAHLKDALYELGQYYIEREMRKERA